MTLKVYITLKSGRIIRGWVDVENVTAEEWLADILTYELDSQFNENKWFALDGTLVRISEVESIVAHDVKREKEEN